MSMASQGEVFLAIEEEREYQTRRWGNPSGVERLKNVAEFLTFMQHYQTEAVRYATKDGNTVNARDAIRKIVALGVACLEQNGIVPRDPRDIEELG